MEHIKSLIKKMLTRKFLVAIISSTVVFGNAMFDWGITNDQVWSILTPLLTWMGIEGWADIKSRTGV